jgi:D-xylose transport system permease protein
MAVSQDQPSACARACATSGGSALDRPSPRTLGGTPATRVSAAIASARLNGGTLDLGQGYELYVIAAAVIGGTTFEGGVGSISGAILGALVMQSLQYGLGFMNFNSPQINMILAVVLIIGVALDAWNPRRAR